jgi:hypothetical protein
MDGPRDLVALSMKWQGFPNSLAGNTNDKAGLAPVLTTASKCRERRRCRANPEFRTVRATSLGAE